MAKKLTINDATKEELIQYFFTTDCVGGGYRIPALKDKFLLWLSKKRSQELLDGADQSLTDSQNALHEYIDNVKMMNDAKDIDAKLKYAEKANEAYERYERANKRYDKLSKKADEVWGL